MNLQLIRGPELFSKWLGQSEENMRKLFEAAEKEARAAEREKREAQTFLLFFDEIDSVLIKRGSAGEGHQMTNQFLTLLDGASKIGNVFVIGTTNRIDQIDEAVLRSGRLEFHVKFMVPDRQAKSNIARLLAKNETVMKNVLDHFSTAASELPSEATGADIGYLMQTAMTNAVMSLVRSDKPPASRKAVDVAAEDIDRAVQSITQTARSA